MAEVSTATSLWGGFTGKAELVGARVMRAGSEEAVAELVRGAAGGVRCTASVARRFPGVARLLGTAETNDRDGAEPAAEVLAGAVFAVAETGSVALDEPAGDRGACFLSERLWVLVWDQDVLASLTDGLRRMHDLVSAGARHPLLMTGPSRTADIERVLTIGVHGPRALVIVIVKDA